MHRFRHLIFFAVILGILLIFNQENNLNLLNKIFRIRKTEIANRSLIDDFVSHSMIKYSGIYTLFGVKPITDIDVGYATEEEDFTANSPWGVATKTQWKAFKKEIKKIKFKNHFFIEYCYSYDDKDYNSILFVHEPSLIKILEIYHNQFEQGLDEKFDSFNKIMELRNGSSRFWDKIFKSRNHYLMGLIFGYGEKNSKCFQMEKEGDKNIRLERVTYTSLAEIKNSFRDDVSIKDLCLPSFISYDDKDDIVEAYKEKRKFIIEYMKGKNLTQEVIILLNNSS